MFFPLPTSDESDDCNDDGNNVDEKVEEGMKEHNETTNDQDEQVVDLDVMSASEIENGVCSICIDEYGALFNVITEACNCSLFV